MTQENIIQLDITLNNNQHTTLNILQYDTPIQIAYRFC